MLGSTATLGLAALAAPFIPPASAATTKRIPGIQLYTVRDAMATDVAETLQAIAGIGYGEVEFAGYFEHTPGQIRMMLERFGLAAPSTHMDARALRDNPQPLVDAAAEIGHDYVTVAWLDPEDRNSLDDYRKWAEVFNRVGEICRSNGLRMAYHNHDFEFAPMQGRVPFDILLARGFRTRFLLGGYGGQGHSRRDPAGAGANDDVAYQGFRFRRQHGRCRQGNDRFCGYTCRPGSSRDPALFCRT
jgi:hypothetical protein